MAEISDRTFTNGETVEADGNEFVRCNFEAVHLPYSGGEHPVFRDCDFGDMGWYFTGAALRTIQLLQQMGAAENGRTFIEDLFRPGHYIGE